MRILFLGTPTFAVPTLTALLSWPSGQVVGLVTQPDRPAGRGNKLQCPPTKVLAQSRQIPVFQPERLSKAPEIVEQMKALKPDVLIMVAFGQILKKEVLEMAPYGVVNLHGSLLPRHRGSAPINWAIMMGDQFTGVCTMFSDKGVDTGRLLLSSEPVPIGPDLMADELAHTMSGIGADLVIETLEKIRTAEIEARVQDESQATYEPLLKKELGNIDWNKSATEIHNLVRGLHPWPGTYTTFDNATLKILKTSQVDSAGSPDLPSLLPGCVLSVKDDGIVVACSTREAIKIIEVQPANRARMTARNWANGARLQRGARFGMAMVKQ